MANKFTKSVLERQAKEYREHPPASAQPVAQPEPVAPIATADAEKPATAVAQEPARRAKPAAERRTPDLTDFIVRDTGRTAKNKTFYLDAAVIDAIHRCASAQKVTDSKLVNDILRKILGA